MESFFQEARKFKDVGRVKLQGDFNAYTSNLPDFIEGDKTDRDMGIEIVSTPIPRNSEDSKCTNERGKDLLDLCKASDMLIVNSRKSGDIFGKYTSFQWNGSRVVDYVISERES